MKKHPKRIRNVLVSMRLNFILVVIFILLTFLSMHLLKEKLLSNAQETGTTLARSYAVEEQNNIAVYETLLSLGAQYIDNQVQEGAGFEDLADWLNLYFKNIAALMNREAIDPYAVVDGTIVAANPWEGDDAFDYASSAWYQMALDADGAIIYTDAYTDSITGQPVITMAKKCKDSDSVLAFDIFPENFRISSTPIQLPEGASYYLCDQQGTLLYSQTNATNSREVLQEYLNDVLAGIEDGSLAPYDAYIHAPDGRQRAVYFDHLTNGWISVVTFPYSTILADLRSFIAAFAVVFVIFLLGAAWMILRDYRLGIRMERTNETVRVLGNSFYALYRVDYRQETYEMIKGSDYIRRRVPKSGPYSLLLDQLSTVIEKDACQEFRESFSTRNIRQLVDHRIRDFGGDFRRLFNEEYRWVNVRVLFDESLSPDEVVLCFREVETEKQQQLQRRELLEAALEAAQKSEKAKNAFFSSMSHDMRTPLNAIIGLSELAQQHTEEPGKLADYMRKINTASRQLLSLINDILEMSRLEQGKVSLNYQEFDLVDCVEDCASVFRAQAEQAEQDFQVTFDITDRMVVGDADRISQILNNLLSNALKFTGIGGHISLRIKQFDYNELAKYQFVVEDNGAGMSAEFVEKIFEPYARETRFGAKNVSGTGLGMPIVKSLVTQMSGQITVESQLGKGSVFTVTIPLAARKSEKKAPKAPVAPQKAQRLDGLHILLAEDNAVNMEIATELLTMSGAEVTQAWNGREAVERFQNTPAYYFDAILMDMQMPELDGCGAARAIRAMKQRPDAKSVPIIAVTANAFAEDIAQTTEAGMNAHVSKPIDFSILTKTLLELIPPKDPT